jgi:hypothetical protein
VRDTGDQYGFCRTLGFNEVCIGGGVQSSNRCLQTDSPDGGFCGLTQLLQIFGSRPGTDSVV